MATNVHVVEDIPPELPPGWDEPRLMGHVAERLRIIAQQSNLQTYGDIREVGREPSDTPGWQLVTWEQDAEPAPPSIMSTLVQAVRVDGSDGECWVPLPTSRTAIIAVQHPMSTQAVQVTAWTAAGQPVNILGQSSISDDEVEVVVTPETVRLTLAAVLQEESTDD
jgi:hypothetical protein